MKFMYKRKKRLCVNNREPSFRRHLFPIRRLEVLAMERGIDVASAADLMVKEAHVTRLGEPDDIAHLITFIVSPQGKLLQGALIDMDGGSTKTI
jgi:NAD(P)-dependent dehydrogenase (short-subunit alcohol dehydrogenase family)